MIDMSHDGYDGRSDWEFISMGMWRTEKYELDQTDSSCHDLLGQYVKRSLVVYDWVESQFHSK